MVLERGFQEISVKRLGCQDAVQRFGATHTLHISLDEDSDSDEENEVDNSNAIPRIEEWKMNLTALSQYHNLYFTAYGDRIYVYRPQGSKQLLSAEPLLVIESQQSKNALCSSCLLSVYHAHMINHMIIGDMGEQEILLVSFHDGDLIAYYTQVVKNAIESPLAGQVNNAVPFFAENVGKSAWGLAIHKQSRLIAAGSNNFEVQVFALGLSGSRDEANHSSSTNEDQIDSEAFGYTDIQFPHVKQGNIPKTDAGDVKRDKNFRLVFKLQPHGDNVPSVAFSSNENGDADAIVAKDIKGCLWVFKLWEQEWTTLFPTVEDGGRHPLPIGWGVLVLPRNFFKPTRNPMETFGCPKSLLSSIIRRKRILDITRTITHVRDTNILHEILDSEGDPEADDSEVDVESDEEEEDEDGMSTPDHDDEINDEDEEDDEGMLDIPEDQQIEMLFSEADPTIASVRGEQDAANEGQEQIIDEDMPIEILDLPMTPPGQIIPKSMQDSPTSKFMISQAKAEDLLRFESGSLITTCGDVILRTYRHNITLEPTFDFCQPTICNNVIRQDNPHDNWFPRNPGDIDRLNMLATIPEISLVLVASQVGRVALLTITRSVDGRGRLDGVVSMRVELILPFAHEETGVDKIRPSCGLLGIAVGPTQGEQVRVAERGSINGGGARRWRLLMHYYNHTVLSYEISRDEETGGVVFF